MAGKLASKLAKAEVVKKFSRSGALDTGSSEVQVALVTQRINGLTTHLQQNPKDFSSQRGLLKLVGLRRRLLDFLRKNDETRYSKLIQSLELRK